MVASAIRPGKRGNTTRESRVTRFVTYLTRSRWSRIDGLVILGAGWLLGSGHRIGYLIAVLVTVIFGASFATDVVRIAARRLGYTSSEDAR